MLVNESTNAMNLIALGNNTNKNNSLGKKDNQANFADFLQPAKKDVSNGVNTVEKKIKDNNESFENSSTVMQDSKEDTNDKYSVKEDKTDDSVNYESDSKEVTNTMQSETKEVDDFDDATVEHIVAPVEFKDDDVEALQELLGNLVQQITQLLNVTPEQLGEKLEELNMNFSDLLSEDGVKEVFLSVQSAEVADLIVDEGLNAEWNQFLEKFDALQQEISEENEEVLTQLDDLFVEEYMTDSKSENVENLFTQKDYNLNQKADRNDSEIVSANDEEDIIVDVKVDSTITKETRNETSSDTKSDSKEKQSNEKEIVNSLGKAIDQVNTQMDGMEMVNVEEVPVSGREIVNQIVEQIRVNINQNNTSLEMQLYPEHLGKIQINVVSKDGVMTARIVAESETAKQAIESGLANLRESFEKQDLKVDAIEVMVSTAGFANSNEEQASYEQQSNSGNRRRMNLDGLEEDDSGEEDVEQVRMEYSGSSVSYMA